MSTIVPEQQQQQQQQHMEVTEGVTIDDAMVDFPSEPASSIASTSCVDDFMMDEFMDLDETANLTPEFGHGDNFSLMDFLDDANGVERENHVPTVPDLSVDEIKINALQEHLTNLKEDSDDNAIIKEEWMSTEVLDENRSPFEDCDLHPEVLFESKPVITRERVVELPMVEVKTETPMVVPSSKPTKKSLTPSPASSTRTRFSTRRISPASKSTLKTSQLKTESDSVMAVMNNMRNLPGEGDAIDKAIYELFPMEVLRLERASFNKWKKSNCIRKLSSTETKRLAKIRRTILARVYAERARQRRDLSHKQAQSENDILKQHNDKLKQDMRHKDKIIAQQIARIAALEKKLVEIAQNSLA